MKRLMITFIMVLFVATVAHGQFTVYTDRSSWEAAVVSFQEEQFGDAVLNAGVSVVTDFGAVSGGQWADVLGQDTDPYDGQSILSETTWMFDPDIYAFGGDWFNIDYGISISFVGDVGLLHNDVFGGAFYGVVSTVPFNMVLLQPGYAPVEHYELDNMVYSFVTTEVDIDIKPGSCPNAFNGKAKGVVPVAIVGTEDFDVLDVDPVTVTLAGVSPVNWSYDDTTEPVEDPDCETCFETPEPIYEDDELVWEYTGDEHLDLILHFNVRELAAAVAGPDRDDCFEVILTGETFDGVPIEGSDFMIMKTK